MRRGDGLSLAERSQRSLRPAEPTADADAETETETKTPIDATRIRPVGQRHCWVTNLPSAPGRRFAGVVVSWAAPPGGTWSGRVIYVVDDEQQPVVVEAWVAAEHLRPA